MFFVEITNKQQPYILKELMLGFLRMNVRMSAKNFKV